MQNHQNDRNVWVISVVHSLYTYSFNKSCLLCKHVLEAKVLLHWQENFQGMMCAVQMLPVCALWGFLPTSHQEHLVTLAQLSLSK